VRAASDLKALARLIPTEARLVLDPGAAPAAGSSNGSNGSSDVEYALVQTSTVRPGDILRVLPGGLDGSKTDIFHMCVLLFFLFDLHESVKLLLGGWMGPACCCNAHGLCLMCFIHQNPCTRCQASQPLGRVDQQGVSPVCSVGQTAGCQTPSDTDVCLTSCRTVVQMRVGAV
jgi:hypothetical protein